MTKEIKKGHTYPYPTMGSYVNAITRNLGFDDEGFFSEQASLERFEKGDELTDPNTWLGAVNWRESDTKKPLARIETNYGRGRMYNLSAEKATTMASDTDILNDELLPEDALNAIALTKAKLTVLEENIPDTYALTQIRTGEMIDYLGNAASEILNGEKKLKVKFNNVFTKVTSDNSRATVSASTKAANSVIALSMALAAACSVMPETTPLVPDTKPKPTEPLPTPNIGVTQQETEQEDTDTIPTPTTNFGLNGEDETGWPSIGIDPTQLIQGMVDRKEEIPVAEVIPELEWDSWGEDNNANIVGLKEAIEDKLVKQGEDLQDITIEAKKASGWFLEVRKNGKIMWSEVTEENSEGGELKRWADHPNFIPSDGEFTFKELDPNEVGFDGTPEFIVIEGTTLLLERDMETKQITGVFNPLLSEVQDIQVTIEEEVQPTEVIIKPFVEMTPQELFGKMNGEGIAEGGVYPEFNEAFYHYDGTENEGLKTMLNDQRLSLLNENGKDTTELDSPEKVRDAYLRLLQEINSDREKGDYVQAILSPAEIHEFINNKGNVRNGMVFEAPGIMGPVLLGDYVGGYGGWTKLTPGEHYKGYYYSAADGVQFIPPERGIVEYFGISGELVSIVHDVDKEGRGYILLIDTNPPSEEPNYVAMGLYYRGMGEFRAGEFYDDRGGQAVATSDVENSSTLDVWSGNDISTAKRSRLTPQNLWEYSGLMVTTQIGFWNQFYPVGFPAEATKDVQSPDDIQVMMSTARILNVFLPQE